MEGRNQKKPTCHSLKWALTEESTIVIFESAKKILFVIHNKTNNLKIKTVPRRINFGFKVCDVPADSRDIYTKIIFALIDKVTNKVAIMWWLLREPGHQ